MGTPSKSNQGVIGIIVIIAIIFLIVKFVGCDGNNGNSGNVNEPDSNSIPSILKPFIANVTGYRGGDESKPYEITVRINPDYLGLITYKTVQGTLWSTGFAYTVRSSDAEMISILFRTSMEGPNHPPLDLVNLRVYRSHKSVLDWFPAAATGTWEFVNE